MVKISFLGDIMCEGSFLAAALEDGKYNFDDCFFGLKEFLKSSDFIIGNLETPLTDSYQNLTRSKDMYSYNTPQEFAMALYNAGIRFVLTANNHCLDRGEKGLFKTIDILDKCSIGHTGTHRDKDEKLSYQDICGVKVGIISCTASTNVAETKTMPPIEHVNVINDESGIIIKKRGIKEIVINDVVGLKRYMRIRKMLGKTALNPTSDDSFDQLKVDLLVDKIISLIAEAKKNSDFVFVCPHMGGQFNPNPGRYSEYVMRRLSLSSADAIIASHPHILQKCIIQNNVPCFFSIGNISMSMGTEYIVHDNHPDLGVIVNAYINDKRKLQFTCTITKITEDEKGYIRVFALYDLIERASGQEKDKLMREYQIAKSLLRIGDLESKPSLEIPIWENEQCVRLA